MASLILRPKHVYDLSSTNLPYFYLVGPVLGGGDWQSTMCRELIERVGDCIIAVPCRWDETHVLAPFFAGTIGDYDRQLPWEQGHISMALHRKRSCVVCWLAAESRASPRKDGVAYGSDTIGEMGRFQGNLEYNKNLKVVAGGEPGFPRLEQIIKPNWHYAYGKPFPFRESIAETAWAAAACVGR